MRLEWVAIIGMALLAGSAEAGDDPVLGKDEEKLSYAVGVSMARSFERQGVEIDVALLSRGLKDGLSGQHLLMSDDELRATMSQLQGELTRRPAKPVRTAAEAKQAGEDFLAANARMEGVVTLPSGLQYKILRAGDGPRPTDGDRVVCHYRGTLIDGTEFDSSYRRGRPAILDVAKVIQGWREALKLMPVGSKWQLHVPPQLAYGERGARGRKRAPGQIGPNAALIFETELLAIKPGPGSRGTKTAASAETPAAREN